MKLLRRLMAIICLLVSTLAQAGNIYIVPVGSPEMAYGSAKLGMFGLIGGLVEQAATAETAKAEGQNLQSATNELNPQLYFVAALSEKLGECGRDAAYSNVVVGEQTKYDEWVDTKTLTDQSAYNGVNADIYIEAYVERLRVLSTLVRNSLRGIASIKVFDAHTTKKLDQYRDYTGYSEAQALHAFASGNEQEKNDELLQATKNALDHLAVNLAKDVCSMK